MEGCYDASVSEMEIVYPEQGSHLVIPRELDGSRGKVILEVSHRNPASIIYWHMDDSYMDKTTDIHKLAVDLDPGNHVLTVVDEKGNTASVRFEVLK